MTDEEIVEKVSSFPARMVILTGGEPSLWIDKSLISRLREAGKQVCIETNGTRPLPDGIDEEAVLMAISPEKDVDAFHAYNVGKLTQGRQIFQPCTPAGVIELLRYSGIEISGKHCVVIGRSDIVGKPMALLLLQNNGTVTICHSKTRNLEEICSTADILVSAVGRAGFVTGAMVKPGAAVIDVGMNRDQEGKLCGDVVFSEADKTAGWITPVPGGVGPMTIAMLMKNTVTAAKLQNELL